jgi:hypothetical protein
MKKMRAIDGQDIMVFLTSRRTIYVAGVKTYQYHHILIPNVRYDYEENDTSGNIIKLPISASRQIDSVSDFRLINEFTETA